MKVRAYLQGGLGNQCFIYATARALCERPLLDLDYLAEDWVFKRNLSLDKFKCQFDVAPLSFRPVRLFKRFRYAILKRFFRRLNGGAEQKDHKTSLRPSTANNSLPRSSTTSIFKFGSYLAELPPYRYADLNFKRQTSNLRLTLDGYWQSEKHFYSIREALVNEFRLKDDSWVEADPICRQIDVEGESAFLHVRTYKEIPGQEDGRAAFQMVDFYQRAIAYLQEAVGVKKFFVFSDDIAIARKIISREERDNNALPLSSVQNAEFVYVENGSQLQDFERMRRCKHGIVADSSFSWWAGWLGEQERLLRGESALRLHVDRRVMNDDYWPDRWVAVKG